MDFDAELPIFKVEPSPREELLELARTLANEAPRVLGRDWGNALRALEVLAAGDDCCGYEGASPRRCREALQILRGER
jgi:hypothetical protein